MDNVLSLEKSLKIIATDCGCGSHCFRNISNTLSSNRYEFTDLINILRSCRSEMMFLDEEKKHELIVEKFRACTTKAVKMNNGKIKFFHCWKIGKIGCTQYEVCRKAFCLAYGFSNTMLDNISEMVR